MELTSCDLEFESPNSPKISLVLKFWLILIELIELRSNFLECDELKWLKRLSLGNVLICILDV